jgi:FtsH-binding integral membrane protein
MRGILGFTRHLFGAMLKGFFFTAIVAAVVCVVALFFAEPGHVLTFDVSAVFALVLCAMAGVLGAAVALIYHLSHLDGVHAMARRYSEMHASERRQARAH